MCCSTQPRGCIAFLEPNSKCDLRIAQSQLRQIRAEEIRANLFPKQLEAFEALGMIEEVVDRMLIMEDDAYEDTAALSVEWTDIDIEIVFDSGCCDHVMDIEHDAPDT